MAKMTIEDSGQGPLTAGALTEFLRHLPTHAHPKINEESDGRNGSFWTASATWDTGEVTGGKLQLHPPGARGGTIQPATLGDTTFNDPPR